MSPDARKYHQAVGVMATGGGGLGPHGSAWRVWPFSAMSTGVAGVFLYFVAHLSRKNNT